MHISLQGRVALVTGGSRGIGRAIAWALAEAGADIAINYRSDHSAAEETISKIESLGRKAKAYVCSVDQWDDDVCMVNQIISDFGSIGILINNAGIASRGKIIADTDPMEPARLMSVHCFAPFYLSKLVVPHMRKLERGDIIMISSGATLTMAANGGPYNMAKAAMEALALTLAKEERKYGIRTNIVAPSLTVTEMGIRLSKAAMGVKDIHELDAESPYGRVSIPEDVASVVTYLVSNQNPYVNGEKITVNGGGK